MKYQILRPFFIISLILSFNSFLCGQAWFDTEVSNYQNPILKWKYAGDTANIKSVVLYRAPLENGEFNLVNTPIAYRYDDDTLHIESIDTTLVEKTLYRYYAQINRKRSGYEKSPVAYGHNLGVLPMVRFNNFDYTSADNSKSILLSWSMTPDPTIKAIQLYRSENADEGFEMIATIAPEENSYRDYVQKANEAYFYFFEAVDYFDNKYVSIVFHALCHYAIVPYPPLNFNVEPLDNKAKLSWQKSSSDIIGYNVYRKNDAQSKYYLRHAILDTATNVTYIDSFPSEGISFYKIESISDGYLKSAPSQVLSFFTPNSNFDIAPSYGSAHVDSNGNIQILWESLEKYEDVMAYKVVKTGDKNQEKELAILDTDHNYYTEADASMYQDHSYRIYGLSLGSVSSHHLEIKYTLPSMDHIVLTNVKWVDEGLQISWTAIPDQYQHINIYRSINQGSFEVIKTLDAQAVEFIDKEVTGESINYQISAVDQNGAEHLISNGINFY